MVILALNVKRYASIGFWFLFFLIFLVFTAPFTAPFSLNQILGQSRQNRISINVDQSTRDKPLDHLLRPSSDGSDCGFESPFQATGSNSFVFSALLRSIDVMQSHFFEVWQGTWPKAIDWTAAVMGTHVSATLSAMSRSEESRLGLIAAGGNHKVSPPMQDLNLENLINQYFTQITSFYFGENAFELRLQAFDDMLWVVLGWLEGVKFINQHSRLSRMFSNKIDPENGIKTTTWYGQQFMPQFAHRARVFYDLASKGWNTSLCGGGMIWSPYLTPYKNAITNQLFIAASISMYLYFPGDENSSPFQASHDPRKLEESPTTKADSRYLDAAIDAYKWLKSSNMTNDQGLYVDGFHISGWRGGKDGSNGSGKCDIRDEMVYTYNQGVLLSGLRGLWEATGVTYYLEDGHELIQSVIAATGWYHRSAKNRWEWAGIGRNGVLEDACDSSGTCSQDGQTFKGIFFHHLASFCAALNEENPEHLTRGEPSDPEMVMSHRKRCRGYIAWVRYNANAAYVTRDGNGKFGTWWGRSPQYRHDTAKQEAYNIPNKGIDHMNIGVPKDMMWRLPDDDALHEAVALRQTGNVLRPTWVGRTWDLNDRGRGRTVETQSGGVAVLRALWQMEGMKSHS